MATMTISGDRTRLGPLTVVRKSGTEPFCNGAQHLSVNLLDFWQWSSSDLASNALRGGLAEFLVAQALGVAGGVRKEWDSFDLRSSTGVRVEVKSAAYLQSWAQRAESAIAFDIRPTIAWSDETNTFAPEAERRRQADVYVFALLGHRDKASLNALDVAQWQFYLLESAILDARLGRQKSVSLTTLLKLEPVQCQYDQLAASIAEVSTTR